MASLILIGIWIVLIIYYIYRYMFTKPPNFPPGPPRIPLLGSYFVFLLVNYNCFQVAFDILCKYYKTKTLGMYFGPFPMIITNDYAGNKEMLNNKAFDGRPDILLTRLREEQFKLAGIFFTQGPIWHTQRRFALRHMRDYGFGRRFPSFELDIEVEIKEFIDLVKNGPKYSHEKEIMENGNVLIPYGYSLCFGNCILKILFNERFERSEQKPILDFAKLAYEFQANGSPFGRIFSLLPFLPYFCPKVVGYEACRKTSMNMNAIMKKIVDEHIRTYDENHERSFLDVYIKEWKTEEKENKKDSSFFYEQLLLTCVDFMIPTITAMGTQMAMLFQRLHTEPEVVRKMQEEIDRVVGQGRLPNLDDRVNSPYTESVIRECMRIDTLLISGLPHFAMESSTFQQYDVPKDTVLYSCLKGSHFDEDKWGDPMAFRPERFMDASTGLMSVKKDFSFPFGAGKRLCAGETFSRTIMFLFVASIYQQFNVTAPTGKRIPSESENHTALITLTPEYWVKFEPR